MMEPMNTHSRIEKGYQLFFESLLSNSIESVLEAAYKLFDSPILFTDEAYRLLYQIPNKKLQNTVWNTILETKVLPDTIVWSYQKHFLNDKIETYKPFYVNWGNSEDAPHIFGQIYNGTQILGHVSIFLMDQTLKEDDLELTELLINALKINLLRKEKGFEKAKPSLSTYLSDLLDKNSSYQAKHLAIDFIKKKIPGNYTLLVSPLGTRAAEKSTSIYVASEISNRYRSVVSTVQGNCIITLIGEVNPKTFEPKTSKFICTIVDFLSQYELVSGICDCFNDLSEVSSRFQQSFLTAKIAMAKLDTFLGVYSEYVPLHMFLDIAMLTSANEIYLHPVLPKIERYDKENKTDFFNTLKIYSLSMHNKDSAAKQLNIHRNTLLYRLNRIQDIFCVSYEDETTALHLLCSFLLLEANKLLL